MLYLVGNPVMLVPNYRNVFKTKFNKLKILDGKPTLNEAESTRKKKKVLPGATSALSSYSQKSVPDPNAMVADINETFTLDLHLRVLQNIDGIYLTEETCKPEILETLTSDASKSSVFWLSYVNHHG